jgi:F-type H+-transporting ATPase subunit delta
MKDRKLALRYARALLAALPAGTDTSAVDGFLAAVVDALPASPEFRDALLNPAFPKRMRRGVLATLAGGRGMPPQVAQFLGVIVDNGRVAALPSIAAAFREVRETADGLVGATLTSAAPLDATTLARATASLERLTGRKVRLTTRVDPALLGGAVAQIGSTVYDGSLRTQLSRLRRNMTQE